MKIIIFPSSYLPVGGGVQEVVSRLAKEFKNRGHEVTIITQRHPRGLRKKEIIGTIPVCRILFPNLISASYKPINLAKYMFGFCIAPFSLLRLFFLIRRTRPDRVYLHFIGIGSLYLLICRLFLDFHLFVTLHGDDVEGLPFLSRFHMWLFKNTCESADFVTACSRDMLGKAQKLCPAIRVKSTTIHNGIDLSEYQKIAGYEYRRPYIFSAGRFVHKKGFDILIKAFHMVVERGHNLDLIIAGDGPELKQCTDLAEHLGLQWLQGKGISDRGKGRVIFWGWANRDEMKSLIAGSRLLAVPSRKEPFGLVVLEGMAAGAPVVASAVGGIPEIITDNCGMLIPPDNEQALADAIESVLTDPSLTKNLIGRARERVKEFSWDRVAQAYLNLGYPQTAQVLPKD